MRRFFCIICLSSLSVGLHAAVGIQPSESSTSANGDGRPVLCQPLKVFDGEHLHNVLKIHPKVFSGGQPDGVEGFKKLQELGVKTLISVDGVKPDVELAHRFAMRYVHLPHGYDGIPDRRAKELAKAVCEMDGPVYVHCHHGRHRSPAAAAVACVTAGFVAPENSVGILEAAGTSKNYRGLYQSARAARKVDGALLSALKVEFQEVVDVPAMADAMVEIEKQHDHLQQFARNHWRPLAEHPDLAPAHEALMLREGFSELHRLDEVRNQPAEFQSLLKTGEQNAQQLEEQYRAWESTRSADGIKQLRRTLDALTRNCTACHGRYRDVPLSEKAK
jgi:protein tyrosine phosphatase (PTP) superfamily phosphohydrolase (DUF442 family)